MEIASFNPQWQQTMIRVKSPQAVEWYEKNFGFQLVDKYEFPQWKFSVYFLATLPKGEQAPTEPGSAAAHEWISKTRYVLLELTYNHDSDEVYISGNVEPHRGFGHIAVNCDDVYEACAKLEAAGVKFQKKPDEGRMKGLAFALDETGYWVEIIRRSAGHTLSTPFNFSQTMLRVKDPKKSLDFYQNVLGMTLISTRHFSDFSLYFLASFSPEEIATIPTSEDDRFEFLKSLHNPVLELTHNHGTESNPDFHYTNGNEPGLRGFGHIGFLVDNFDEYCSLLDVRGIPFKKKPTDGNMRNLAFILDPDNYWIEIMPRGRFEF